MNPILKLVILDVDGVMTDGSKLYDWNHQVIAKEYNDKDFTAIKRFKKCGVSVCLLSGDNCVNEGMAKTRNIDFFYSRNKLSMLPNLFSRYRCSNKNTAYIGDDIFDIPVLREVEFSFCPSDAVEDVVEQTRHVLSSCGGSGVVAEMYSWFVNNGFLPKRVML